MTRIWKRLFKELVEMAIVEAYTIQTTGLELVGAKLDGSSTDYLAYLGWSDDTASPSAANTTLPSEDSSPRILLQSSSWASPVQNLIYWMPAAYGNTPGTIAKVALFTAVTSGTMFNEHLFSTAQTVAKTASKEVLFSFDITIAKG